jgi:hypothetical protein
MIVRAINNVSVWTEVLNVVVVVVVVVVAAAAAAAAAVDFFLM